jgi:TonB family protein
MKPASVVLESKSESGLKTASSPALLVTFEPWHTVFWRNLSDLFQPARQTPFLVSSRPGSFWPDVFVRSRLPWKRFAQSGMAHVALVLLLWGSVRLGPQNPEVTARSIFSHEDVVYYAPSEYLPPLDTGGAHKRRAHKGEPEHAPQPIISVPAEADNRTQTIVTPSNIKLNHDVPMPNIVAWSQNKTQPMAPLASTSSAPNLRLPAFPVNAVAPAPETMPANRQRSMTLSQTAVAPAPDITAESSRAQQAPQAAIVQPPPRVDAASQRRLGDVNIGHSQVVAPAPELPVSEQYAAGGRTQSALGGGAGSAVVAPPPSIPGTVGSTANGRIISLGIHPAAMAAAEMPSGNRRGTFAATPGGKTGAPGTPDVVASANPGSASGTGNNTAGIPSGLSVGAGPANQKRSAVAGPGSGSGNAPGGNSDNRLVADATPPRVTSTPARPLSEVSKEKATDVDRWIFGDKKFYAMTLNMPNLNSGGGSWVIRFAELNPDETKGDLSAPEATQKVDPAYPMELMRRNIQGTVTLYAVIRNDGSVSDVRVLRGVDDQLDQYARSALARWHFRPATKNGAAVDLEAVVMIPFKPVRLKSSF